MQGKIFENHHSLNTIRIGISSQLMDFLHIKKINEENYLKI